MTEIELSEYMEVKNKNMEKSENVDCVLKIRGLPFSADEQYIVKLFEGNTFFFTYICYNIVYFTHFLLFRILRLENRSS